MKQWKSYLTSLVVVAAVYSTSIFENAIYEGFIKVVVWTLILVGGLSATIIVLGTIVLTIVNNEEVSAEVTKSWAKMEKPTWWISIPLILLWVSTLSYVGWTITGIAYLVETTLLITAHLIFVKVHTRATEGPVDEDDVLNHIKDPDVRETIKELRKKKGI